MNANFQKLMIKDIFFIFEVVEDFEPFEIDTYFIFSVYDIQKDNHSAL